MPSSRGSSRLRDRTLISSSFCSAGEFFTAGPLGKSPGPLNCPHPLAPPPTPCIPPEAAGESLGPYSAVSLTEHVLCSDTPRTPVLSHPRVAPAPLASCSQFAVSSLRTCRCLWVTPPHPITQDGDDLLGVEELCLLSYLLVCVRRSAGVELLVMRQMDGDCNGGSDESTSFPPPGEDE